MWTYRQGTGELRNADGRMVGVGYSGNGPGKNNPDWQDVHNTGPIPRGTYTIGPLHDTADHGPDVLALTPAPGNQMFGRAGFLMHGDSISAPGTASQGCIIMAHLVRLQVGNSGDKLLEVIE